MERARRRQGTQEWMKADDFRCFEVRSSFLLDK